MTARGWVRSLSGAYSKTMTISEVNKVGISHTSEKASNGPTVVGVRRRSLSAVELRSCDAPEACRVADIVSTRAHTKLPKRPEKCALFTQRERKRT